MNEMKEDIPRIEMKVIEGCDQCLIVENPGELDKLLEEFSRYCKDLHPIATDFFCMNLVQI